MPTLRTILTGRTDVNALDLADYVVHLPPGCALWREAGGPLAWSIEAHMLSHAIHAMDTLVWQNTGIMTRNPKGKQPKPMEPPRAVGEVRAVESRLGKKQAKRAARAATRPPRSATDDGGVN